jgi:hypothetical protein
MGALDGPVPRPPRNKLWRARTLLRCPAKRKREEEERKRSLCRRMERAGDPEDSHHSRLWRGEEESVAALSDSATEEGPVPKLRDEAPPLEGVTIRCAVGGAVLWESTDAWLLATLRTAEDLVTAAGMDAFTTRLLLGSRPLRRASPLRDRDQEGRLDFVGVTGVPPEEVAGLRAGDRVAVLDVRYFDWTALRGAPPLCNGKAPVGIYHSWKIKEMQDGGEAWREVAIYVMDVKPRITYPMTAFPYALRVAKV